MVVVADADAEAMVRTLIDRGLERRCLEPTEYAVRRHPMRDAAVCRNPLSALQGMRPGATKVLVVFDLPCGIRLLLFLRRSETSPRRR